MVGVVLWLAVAQTSPLAYIGIDQVGRYLADSGTVVDSTFFPSPVDTTYGVRDSLLAVKDTTINGAPGKILFQFNFEGGNLVGTDTLLVWENGSDVMAFFPVGDSVYPVVYYRTPLSTVQAWSMGIPYATPGEFGGDTTQVDTLFVPNDTVRVLGQEAVSVPLGNFNAFHILRTIEMVVKVTNPGTFDPESIHVIIHNHEWLVPSIGPVKDSTYLEINAKIFGSWTLIQKKYTMTEAYDRGLPVQESQPVTDGSVLLRVEGRRFFLQNLRPGSQVDLVDALGRRLGTWTARRSAVEGMLPDRKGLYWIRVVDPSGKARTFRTLRLR